MIFMIVLSAQLEGMQSRADKSWKLIIGTQELTPDQIGTLGQKQEAPPIDEVPEWLR